MNSTAQNVELPSTLKSDHFGIEIPPYLAFPLLVSELKSDHFGIEIL